jgi:hypothetical protein
VGPIKSFYWPKKMNETLKFGNAAAASRANPGVKRFNFPPKNVAVARWSVQVTGPCLFLARETWKVNENVCYWGSVGMTCESQTAR